MNSKAKLFGHPIHQMLIVFPLGLLATSLIFDIVYQITDNGRWADIAYVMIASTEALVPGEHGFRFFPSFYRHLFDTMARTPVFQDQSRSLESGRCSHSTSMALERRRWSVLSAKKRAV